MFRRHTETVQLHSRDWMKLWESGNAAFNQVFTTLQSNQQLRIGYVHFSMFHFPIKS